MLGSFGVGKTSLVRKFVYNKFEEKYLTTIGVHISQKTIEINDIGNSQKNLKLNVIIWDIAHIAKFDSVIKNYFKGSHGAVVVFDLTRTQTINYTDAILKSFLTINPQSKLVFIGNKVDLVNKKNYEMEQFLNIAKSYNSKFLLTSAKTGENVDALFVTMGNLLMAKQ